MMANPAIELLTGRVPADFSGLPATSAFVFTCATLDATTVLREAMDGWRAVAFPDGCSVRHANGSEIPIAASATPLYHEDGAYAGIILVIRDTSRDTELKHQQYAFFSFATHQMRQPLASLRLTLEGLLMRKEKLDPEHREIFEELLQTVLASTKLVKELLTMARLEQGRIDLTEADVDVQQLLEEIGKEFVQFSVSHNVVLRMFPNTMSWMPCVIRADRERLKDAFHNLITNAISYNRPNGEVAVDLFRVPAGEAARGALKLNGSADLQSYFAPFVTKQEPSGAPFLIVTIKDTGLGIPEKDQSSLFRAFFRGQNVERMGLPGTGLGLSIVKSIMERSGGRIGFESQENVGTTFYLFFPLTGKEKPDTREEKVQEMQKRPPAVPVTSSHEKRTILIIDDDQVIIRILQHNLMGSNVEFLLAPNVAEGIQKAHENMPDLIILDIMVGGQSGLEVLEKIKHAPATASIPVIILSAVDQEDVIAKTKALGAADYILKGSVSLNETLTRIQKHLYSR